MSQTTNFILKEKFTFQNGSLESFESDSQSENEEELTKIKEIESNSESENEEKKQKAKEILMNLLKSSINVKNFEKEIVEFYNSGCEGKDVYLEIFRLAKINKKEKLDESLFLSDFLYLDSFFPIEDLDPCTYLRIISYGFEFKLFNFADWVGSINHEIWKKNFVKMYCSVLITDKDEYYCKFSPTTRNMKTLSSFKFFLSEKNESFLNLDCFKNTVKYKSIIVNKKLKERSIDVTAEWKDAMHKNWSRYKDESYVKCNISAMMKEDKAFLKEWKAQKEALLYP